MTERFDPEIKCNTCSWGCDPITEGFEMAVAACNDRFIDGPIKDQFNALYLESAVAALAVFNCRLPKEELETKIGIRTSQEQQVEATKV